LSRRGAAADNHDDDKHDDDKHATAAITSTESFEVLSAVMEIKASP